MCTKQIRILIAEDDEMLLSLYTRTLMLDFPDAAITAVENGSLAKKKFKKAEDTKPFDIVITDFKMPKCDGLKLAEYIKKRNKTMPIILNTGTPPSKTPSFIDIIIIKGSEPENLPNAIKKLLKL